jgi:integrase/recombinase XerD
MPVSVMIDKIIRKRKGPSTIKEDYIFPILENGLTPLEMDNRFRTFIRNTNKHLVKIGKELGLTMKMTSYVAKHSFATIQKNNNAPLAYISEALGHSNLKTTQNYFGRFEDEGLKVFHSGLMDGWVAGLGLCWTNCVNNSNYYGI